MTYFISFLPLASFIFCAFLCLVVLLRRRWNPTAVSFLAGMASLATIEISNYFALKAPTTGECLSWHWVGLVGEALFVGSWLLFSVVFAKGFEEWPD
jgi:hypothetical protein